VRVQSEVGRGSTFKVCLPRTDEFEETPDVRPVHLSVPDGHETILVVEDEDSVREFVQRVLRRHGYVVHAVGDPRQALEFGDAHPGGIDLILTDVVLRGMNGRTMALQMQQRRPESRVLYMSGYTDDAILHHGVLDEGVWFLQKPFTAEVLLKKTRDVLES